MPLPSALRDNRRPIFAATMARIGYVLAACLFFIDVSGCTRKPARSFHIINLGLPRTGTTSFAEIFANFNATHEFMMADTVFAILDFREKKLSKNHVNKFLKSRDKRANHWVDSATFFFLEPELVMDTFPDAKYFFALRPCEEWIVSMVDRFNTLYRMRRAGVELNKVRYIDRFGLIFSPHLNPDVFSDVATIRKHAPQLVQDLAEFWRTQSIRTLEAMARLKPEQRLVIHLKDMSNSLEVFAAFSGVPIHMLNARGTHVNKDTHARETREVLGGQLIQKAAATEQSKMDAWLVEHPGVLTGPGWQ